MYWQGKGTYKQHLIKYSFRFWHLTANVWEMYPNLTSKGSSREIAGKLSLSWNLIWNCSWFSNFFTTSNWWKSALWRQQMSPQWEALRWQRRQGQPRRALLLPHRCRNSPPAELLTFTSVTRKVPKKPKPSMSNTLYLDWFPNRGSNLTSIQWVGKMVLFPSHPCWYPPGHPSSSHWILCTWTFWEWGNWRCNWNNAFLRIVFSFETVQYWPWKFPKNRRSCGSFCGGWAD